MSSPPAPTPTPPAPPASVPFLHVPTLLDRSHPRIGGGWFWYIAGTFLLIVLVSAYASSHSEAMAVAVRVVSAVAMLGVMGVMVAVTLLAARRQRDEVKQIQAVEELVQLRRWPEAAMVLEDMLSHPTRTGQARAQALIFLSSVLARYHRFSDAIAVQEHLLEDPRLDDAARHALRLGRAMAMLREDHLVDADRAINELRRSPQGKESAGLALVELYRDVKTGHPVEALLVFDEKLPLMRDQLGHRLSDAYALAAKAHDQLGHPDEARRAYERATLLSPPGELARRYPEVAPLSEKYQPAVAPPEAA
jgi:tetratricopeptide (TPR) repeat protein